ncbi:DEAD (Asp-Glu-Ala-Asp) box polypeptide 52, variant 3 [Schistosoma haematobium]|nr:DEAD (Asp-Glu-Ala-Asp) box polypeptide 52, variant 3 [Schistosoma haematobium]KAH9591306.1 DEAD (Asp-Glu-Ala-Asp) box polypeptide 52, variant 3 [Schistosoma haematobium]
MGRGFADVIIVEGLDQFVENDNDASYIIRLTNLLEDTRQFIHSFTKETEHGHNCKLIVSSSLKSSHTSKKPDLAQYRDTLPAHAMIRTFFLQGGNGSDLFDLYSVEDNWKLNLRRQYDEVFWTTNQ